MKQFAIAIIGVVIVLALLPSCAKNASLLNDDTSTNTNREQPAQPEGFSIDTTWGEGINVPF